MFNVITGMNESKLLTKLIPYNPKCKRKFDGRKVNSNQKLNKCRYWCKCKKHIYEKDYIWNPATKSCENDKHLESVIDNLVITCNETMDAGARSYDDGKKTIPTNFNKKATTCKTQNFYIFLAFLLIIIVLLIAVSISCYLIKYRAKQKTFNTILRKVLY